MFGIHDRIPPEHFVPDLETAKKLAWELVNGQNARAETGT